MAIKFLNEKVNLKSFNKEVNFLKELGDEKYFPKIFYSQYNEQNKIIIQSLLGPDLKQLLSLCGGSFPLNTILNKFIDLLKRLEVMHANGILHRDINPKNVVFCNFSTLNNDEKDTLYLIDYGLSTKFIGDDDEHYQYKMENKFIDSLKYASVHALNLERQSRQDDLESLFSLIIYLFRGNLPWDSIESRFSTLKKCEIIKDTILNADINELLFGLPDVFKFIYKNIKMLSFDEKLPYEHFITLLEKEKQNLKVNNDYKIQYKFIWTEKIINLLFSENKKSNVSKNQIRNLFNQIKINYLKNYFKSFKKIY